MCGHTRSSTPDLHVCRGGASQVIISHLKHLDQAQERRRARARGRAGVDGTRRFTGLMSGNQTS